MLFKNPTFSIKLFIFYWWPNIPVVLGKKQNNSRKTFKSSLVLSSFGSTKSHLSSSLNIFIPSMSWRSYVFQFRPASECWQLSLRRSLYLWFLFTSIHLSPDSQWYLWHACIIDDYVYSYTFYISCTRKSLLCTVQFNKSYLHSQTSSIKPSKTTRNLNKTLSALNVVLLVSTTVA